MTEHAIEPVSKESYRNLMIEKAFVGGRWCGATEGHVIEVFNPADRSRLGGVPDLGAVETRRAVDAAAASFDMWRRLLPQDRAGVLLDWHDRILRSKRDLAALMTAEQGKPLAEAEGEIEYAASFVRWFAEEGRRLYGETIPSHLPNAKLIVTREPLGVVAVVTPWNFPSAMLTRKVAAALAAGCTAVAVPSSQTPFSALALAQLAEKAGLPEGVLSVLTGRTRTIVGELLSDARVRGLSFTGSTEVGRQLFARSGATIKRLVLELGGHAPFIVFPDVDLETAVGDAIGAKFQTTGQDCLAANRIYVHADIYESFVERFSAAAASLKIGNGFEPDVAVGPLIDDEALAKVEDHVEDARMKGARITAGGRRHALGGLFYAPTVVADVTPDMKLVREESFGPVAALIPFTGETDVIDAANDTEYGLVAYVYTRDLSRAWRMTDALQYGMVAVNRATLTGAPIPFGGVKQSGIGREGAHHGIEAFTELKYVCMGVGEARESVSSVGVDTD